MARYTTVTEVESQSREGVKYLIQVNLDTGHLTCSCPAYKFQKKEVADRWCKHTIMVEKMGVVDILLTKAKERQQPWVNESELIVWANST